MDTETQAQGSAPRRDVDATDLGILVALQSHARSSVAQLARGAGRSEATIRQRMEALSSSRVIRSHHADVDIDLLCPAVEAFVQATADMRELPRIRSALAALPCVLAADITSGDRGIMIHVVARSKHDLWTLLGRDIAPLGLERADVQLLVRPLVRDRAPDLMGLIGPRPRLRTSLPNAAEPAEPFEPLPLRETPPAA